MARLLIRAGENQSRKVSAGLQHFAVGDILAVLPDGWLFSRIELSDPLFLCLDVPDLNLEEAQRYQATVRPDPGGGFEGFPSLYSVALGRLKGPLDGGLRRVTRATFLAAVTAKDVPKSPFVITG